MIWKDTAAFVESGVSILVGTRTAQLMPEAVRGCGASVLAGGEELLVFIPEATGAATIANIEDNGRIAVTFCRPFDHRSLQFKGKVVEVRRGTAADRAVVENYRCAFAQELAVVGVPGRISLRMATWPAYAVRLRVATAFDQTPGPGAGARYGAARDAGPGQVAPGSPGTAGAP